MSGILDDSPTIAGGTDNTPIGNDGDALKVSSYQAGPWSLGRTWTLFSGTDSVSAVQSGTWNIGTLTSITNPVAVTQSTSPWVVSGTVTASEDKDFGTVGANTLRVAALIGNATGAAAFNSGNTNAQTLRVVIASNQVVIPVGGNVGSGATDSGNPVKIGAVHLTTQPTVTNNQRVNLQATNRGALIVSTGVDAFNINNITGTVSLPTGAATAALQTTGNTSLASIDTKLVQLALDYGASAGALRVASQIGNATGAAAFNAGVTNAQTLRVVLPTDQTAIPVTQSGTWNIGTLTSITDAVTVNQGTSPWVVSGTVTANAGTGTFAISAASLPLPTGAATEATLSALNSKFALDFGVSTGAVRVAALLGNATGSAAFNAGVTNAQTLRVVLPTDQTAIPVTQSGTWTTGRTWSLASGADSVTVVQGTSPWVVSGTVTASNPSVGLVASTPPTSATYIGGSVTTAAPTYTTGQMNALSLTTSGLLRVDGSGVTQPISAASLPLPAGAATSALQTTGNTSLSSIDTKLVQLALNYGLSSGGLRTASQIGNATGAADFNAGNSSAQTLRVVVATNQSAIPVTQSTSPWVVSGTVTANAGTGTFAISAASLPLPAGAATSALQTTGNTSLASIDTKLVQLALNYGVATSALRVAAQVGNASGVADFNYGTVGAQTLRAAAQLGNATGAADFNSGNFGAQTLRVVVATNQPAIPVTQSTTPWAVSDALSTTGVQGAITVTSSSIEAKVGVSRLVGRKLLTVFNDGTATIWWGYSSGVTTSSGTPIFRGQQFNWNITDGLGVWLIAASGSHNVRVTEAS